jgi:hypothetical protein
MFVWDCDNLIENKTETNYEDQFKINQMLKEKMKRKRKKRIHSKEKNWKMRFFKKELFNIVFQPNLAGQPLNLLTQPFFYYIRMFVWEHDNLIKSKSKQIMITNSKSTKILKEEKKLRRIQLKEEKFKR